MHHSELNQSTYLDTHVPLDSSSGAFFCASAELSNQEEEKHLNESLPVSAYGSVGSLYVSARVSMSAFAPAVPIILYFWLLDLLSPALSHLGYQLPGSLRAGQMKGVKQIPLFAPGCADSLSVRMNRAQSSGRIA